MIFRLLYCKVYHSGCGVTYICWRVVKIICPVLFCMFTAESSLLLLSFYVQLFLHDLEAYIFSTCFVVIALKWKQTFSEQQTRFWCNGILGLWLYIWQFEIGCPSVICTFFFVIAVSIFFFHPLVLLSSFLYLLLLHHW